MKGDPLSVLSLTIFQQCQISYKIPHILLFNAFAENRLAGVGQECDSMDGDRPVPKST
ncbi:MAG: hypothetical protein JSS69_18415, partial [Acidobacteria bacterium]|nr:hypothetical protein [Acidobacteriota bacterium]